MLCTLNMAIYKGKQGKKLATWCVTEYAFYIYIYYFYAFVQKTDVLPCMVHMTEQSEPTFSMHILHNTSCWNNFWILRRLGEGLQHVCILHTMAEIWNLFRVLPTREINSIFPRIHVLFCSLWPRSHVTGRVRERARIRFVRVGFKVWQIRVNTKPDLFKTILKSEVVIYMKYTN